MSRRNTVYGHSSSYLSAPTPHTLYSDENWGRGPPLSENVQPAPHKQGWGKWAEKKVVSAGGAAYNLAHGASKRTSDHMVSTFHSPIGSVYRVLTLMNDSHKPWTVEIRENDPRDPNHNSVIYKVANTHFDTATYKEVCKYVTPPPVRMSSGELCEYSRRVQQQHLAIEGIPSQFMYY